MAHKFFKFGFSSWALIVEAGFFLSVAKLATLLLPYPFVARVFSLKSGDGPSSQEIEMAKRVGWAVRGVAHRLPWESACLPQAIAAKLMLVWRNIESMAFIGVTTDAVNVLRSHAWLRCGPVFVTGEKGHEPFRVISKFDQKHGDE